MRQLFIQVQRQDGDRAFSSVEKAKAINIVRLQAHSDSQPTELLIAHVSNRRVGALLKDLDGLPDAQVTMAPQGIFAFELPTNQVSQQVTDIQFRSPVEVFLGGLQSIGSWKGFLGYAVVASIVTWIGLITDSIPLLIGGMLIAPFAGPAMNVAIATARGDSVLLRRSLFRYLAAIVTTTMVAALLTLIMDQQIISSQMAAVGEVSIIALLLPLAVGVAAALNLLQSQRSSLVSETATGVLVAVSVTPPAALVGMASVMGEWQLVRVGLFLVLLQLVGVNLTGSLAFRMAGLSARSSRYERGRAWLFPVAVSATIFALASLLFWQLRTSPELERATVAQRAAREIQDVVQEHDTVVFIEVTTRFGQASSEGKETLLGELYVQRTRETSLTDAELQQDLTRQIQAYLTSQDLNVTPLISVNVLRPLSLSTAD